MSSKPAAASNAGFVHLHTHSAYSLLKGSIKIEKLAALAKADHQPALALTDTDNMFGALEFSEKLAGYLVEVEESWGTGKLVPNFAPIPLRTMWRFVTGGRGSSGSAQARRP